MTGVTGDVASGRVRTMQAGRSERLAQLTAAPPSVAPAERSGPIEADYHRFRSTATKIELPHRITTYCEAISIRNHTERLIYIRGRDGSIIGLSPEPLCANYPQGIYYTIGFRRDPHVSADESRYDGTKNLITGRLLHACRSTGRTSLEINDVNTWYRITPDELMQRGGTVYLEEIDKIVSIRDPAGIGEHPFTLMGVDEALERMVTKFTRSSAGIMVYVIDNDDEFGKRYINLNGVIMAVEPIVDRSRASGVYVKMTGAAGNQKQGIQFYEFPTLHDSCPVRFHRTIGEAEQLGTEIEAKKQELETTKLDRELELVNATTEQKRVTLARAEQKDHIELGSLIRKDTYEERSAARKDTYEERSTERKDESEENKAAIAAVGGLAAIAGVGYKVLSSKKSVRAAVVTQAAIGGTGGIARHVASGALQQTALIATAEVVKTHALGTVVQSMVAPTVLKLGMKLIGG